MSVTFIGDVHGWSARLDRVLAQTQGHLVFMGDLIDRGPDSPGVIARVRALCERGEADCLLGNHEYALLHALGSPRLGIAADSGMFHSWRRSFGGAAVLRAYGLDDDDAAGLRSALGDHLTWMAGLPWMLEGEEAGQHWVAVHAGLSPDDVGPQLMALRRGWAEDDGGPAVLFDKARAFCVPADLPDNWCVVSGHTPLKRPLIDPQRILCDTSGGMADRALSGVIWPEGRVINSDAPMSAPGATPPG